MHVVAYLQVAAALLVAVDARAAKPVFQRNLTRTQFLDHVLMHQKEWTLVMQERVRNLRPPPHGVQHIVSATEEEGTDVWQIVFGVVADHMTVGSAVEYAADAVHAALTCFTYRHVTFQAHYVQGLLIKEVLPDTVHAELSAFKDVIVLALDKLSVVPADLPLLFEVYWEVARLMQFDVVHHMRRKRYPPRASYPIGDLHGRLVDYLRANCTAFRLDRQFFAGLGVNVPNDIILDDLLRLVVEVDAITRLGRDHAKSLARYYRNLKIEVMPRRQWTQIFYYARNVPEDEELDQTNQNIGPIRDKHWPQPAM